MAKCWNRVTSAASPCRAIGIAACGVRLIFRLRHSKAPKCSHEELSRVQLLDDRADSVVKCGQSSRSKVSRDAQRSAEGSASRCASLLTDFRWGTALDWIRFTHSDEQGTQREGHTMRKWLLGVTIVLAAVFVGSRLHGQRYLSGIIWPEPPVVTPGERQYRPVRRHRALRRQELRRLEGRQGLEGRRRRRFHGQGADPDQAGLWRLPAPRRVRRAQGGQGQRTRAAATTASA